MKREVKTVEWECDYCKRTERVTDLKHRVNSFPEGWGSVESHGHGMTNYSTSFDACPECLKNRKS